ncbi:MAG: Flp pilus assembly protein CpaB [Comamonadaceae bacterium]|nr:MAG: Flp pilus assembly protein CpaB [Comamonadaceae bacterium]
MIHLTKIIAAILVLLALSLGGYAWMLSRKPAPVATVTNAGAPAQAPEATRLFPVVVTSKAVPAGEVLTADMLRVAQLPINPAGAFTETSAAAGRATIADMGEGTPVLQNQLITGLALRLASGERAVAVKADEVMGVGNRVQPGDFVDVFVSLKTDSREIDRSHARLILSRKRVLAFGNASVDGGPSKAEKAENRSGGAQARTVVLAIPVEEINILTVGETSGNLLLALRNPNDLAVHDKKLFPEPPLALKPLPAGARPADSNLSGIDRAHAGLAVEDYASGAGSRARTANATATNVAQRPPGQRSTPRTTGGIEVEVIRGDRSETVRY